jgi:hypothetical protein
MFFLAGAASSVLDFLGSLQGASGAQQNSGAAGAPSGQGQFSLAAPPPTTGGASTSAASGTGGFWSSPETMGTLLSAQSGGGATGGTGAPSGANVLGTIEQLLASIENQLGAGQPSGSDSDADGVSGHGGHHHHGGIEQLLQALEGQSGTDPSAASSGTGQSGTTQNVTNADGSTTTTITYADGSTVTMTSPASLSSADSSATSGTPGSGTGPLNPLERLIQQQAQMFAAATAGQGLSTIA